jgi:hypothetical protein
MPTTHGGTPHGNRDHGGRDVNLSSWQFRSNPEGISKKAIRQGDATAVQKLRQIVPRRVPSEFTTSLYVPLIAGDIMEVVPQYHCATARQHPPRLRSRRIVPDNHSVPAREKGHALEAAGNDTPNTGWVLLYVADERGEVIKIVHLPALQSVQWDGFILHSSIDGSNV